MSEFKMIKRAFPNLQVWSKPYKDDQLVVTAEELEKILQSAKVVYGSPDTPSDQLAWSNTQLDCDTHKALLLAVEPIKKKTKAEVALEFIREIEKLDHGYFRDKAKKILEMKEDQ